MYLYQKFQYNLHRILKVKKKDSILIAVSGGQDSLCLTKLIQDISIQDKTILKIDYIYIDHQWRKDSKKHIQHLINFIRTTKYSISIYEIYKHTKSELEARKLRYQILLHHAITYNFNIIMTGHTETDKIENFFQQLIRGTSIDGATSLNLSRKLSNQIELWRPLINYNRNEIYWFCRKFYLPIWLDSTNYQYVTKRNRVRYELIPYLNQYFHINISKNINNFLQITNIDNEYLKQNAIKLYLISIHPISIALNYKFIEKQHKALKHRVIQLFFYHHFNISLNTYIIQKIISILSYKNSKCHQIHWQNLLINIYNNWIYIN